MDVLKAAGQERLHLCQEKVADVTVRPLSRIFERPW